MNTQIFNCGHPRTPENTHNNGSGYVRCRECKLAEKRRWRERAREKAEAKRVMRSPVLIPRAQIMPNPEPLSPEAYGSRELLIAYARYYEMHVKSEAA
jgi:hypothetical protein